jgi:DNA-binding HxlR family transcriptional regulator
MEVIDLDRLSPAECEKIKRMMAHVGSKWAPMILSTLAASPHRFGELKRALPGISQRILTLTLREMERDGLVSRVVTPTIPPRVDYSMTELGSDLAKTIAALGRWSIAHADRIEAAHSEFDSRS